ncbi:Integrase family protein [Hyella patelloides LEGE 07179]|uniref:Integrase family protein n=1 Tax=Hyella patelloides LEGE 07179 TaxID=945734 RepID=A0A563VLA9_9CYAN|nr:tyrosine-type recombinase/integrase [Hyella patelloides]VEP12095.1 Integrase family protein [Hyella patelloides LEGE 07179]
MPIYQQGQPRLSSPARRQKAANLVLLPTTEAMLQCFAQYLNLNVADGDAAPDTITTYNRRVHQYLAWCQQNQITPAHADKEAILLFRSYLIKQRKQKPNTIALTLVVIRRFYAACLGKNLVKENPVIGVKPPRSKVKQGERITYLTLSQLELVLLTIGNDGSLKILRDRALFSLMALEGLRSVELWRANLGDFHSREGQSFLKVEGKSQIRTVPVRADIVRLLEQYKNARKQAGEELNRQSPLMISLSNQTKRERLSRRGIEYIVDGYLEKTDLKRIDNQQSRSTHSLRHTAGTLGLAGGSSLRQVQELLGHSDPKTTAIYAHITERYENNPAKGIDVKI